MNKAMFVLALLAVNASGCAHDSIDGPLGGMVSQVICSGLPDPAWSISEATVLELRERAAALPTVADAPAIERGSLSISLTKTEHWHLTKGYLTIWDNQNGVTHRADVDGRLRSWLLPHLNALTRDKSLISCSGSLDSPLQI